ncbi:E2 [Human papillomavirus type 211]|uniref:Regulatory protein E2 n=1 Tax=Human papillomavirus type 211 TaxID=2060135 RepID=A0A2R4QL86_9PAPI|nr:E2 [Human papillomavirus type 211]
MARKEETQESLTERFDALQEAILTMIEANATDLESHLKYWDLVRKENVTLYYARKCGYNRLGLQPTPTPAVSEYNAKQAIKIQMLIKSLLKSPYANEKWTLSDTSAEILNTQPKDCFKKQGYTVEVWYDNERSKAFPYTNWTEIYYQDEANIWHKTEGAVGANGLYYKEINGDVVYFHLFGPDAEKYGSTGEWTIHSKHSTIVSSSSFAKRSPESHKRKRDESAPSTSWDTPSTSQSIVERRPEGETVSSTEDLNLRPRRGGQQRKLPTTAKRRRLQPELSSYPTPGEVGTRHRSASRTGLTRLQQLQREAWDPPILIVKGPANSLKCWRNRLKLTANSLLYEYSSTVWKWIGENNSILGSRMLLSFASVTQRNQFLKVIKPPKGTVFALGSFDSL